MNQAFLKPSKYTWAANSGLRFSARISLFIGTPPPVNYKSPGGLVIFVR